MRFDKSNTIHHTAIIADNVEIGKNNVIGPYTVIGEHGAIRGEYDFTGKIIIGDNNIIGAHCAVMLGVKGSTRIGNGNLIMNYVNVGHNVKIGNMNEIGAGTIIGGHCTIKSYNKIKLACTIRNRIEIGSGYLIGMMANVVGTIKDRDVFYGNPATLQGHQHEKALND